MARINIEDSIHKDARFDELTVKLGGKQNAIGAIVWAWIIAQPYWVDGQSGIPQMEWEKQKCNNAIIEVGLATDAGAVIYVAGSRDQFAWLVNAKIDGKKGGLKTAENRRHPAPPLQGSQASSSSSSSFSKNKEEREEKITRHPAPPLQGSQASSSSSFSKNKEEREEKITRSQIEALSKTWVETLHHFGVKRNLSLTEENQIARGAMLHGAEFIDLALYGYRFRPEDKNFNPRNSVALKDIFAKDKNGNPQIDRYVNLGAQRNARRNKDNAVVDGKPTDGSNDSNHDEPAAGDSPEAFSDILKILRGPQTA